MDDAHLLAGGGSVPYLGRVGGRALKPFFRTRSWCSGRRAHRPGRTLRSSARASIRRKRRVRREEGRHVPGERFMKLEQRTVARIRVHEKHGVRKVLDQTIRVRDRNHLVVNTVDDKRGLMNTLETGEPGSRGLLP